MKFDQCLIEGDKFVVGGVHAASISLELLNYEGTLDNVNFDNKEFEIEIKLNTKELYTVNQVHTSKVSVINSLQIKHLTSLWIPVGKFYPTSVKRNVNNTISIKLTDKTKFMEDEYVSNLGFPATLKQIRNEVYEQLQIVSDTGTFLNENQLVETKPEGYTHKQILGYIAECACGFEVINRLGNAELKSYSTAIDKSITKGVFKEFVPNESYVTIKKVKYYNGTIGEDSGHILELDENNPFVTDSIAQNVLNQIRNFTYIVYTHKLAEADIATDCGDKISITDIKDNIFNSYIMSNSWEFNGSITQDWSAKGENELSNTYGSNKGPITQAIERIRKEEIPSMYENAVSKATELITKFNGGCVIKKDGELFICDNEDIDKAQRMWRWNLNGLGYSSNGLNGPFGLAMTMDGQIVADYITAGTMLADMIKGGTLKLGGSNNLNGLLQILNSSGNVSVQMNNEGIQMADGTGLIGGDGVYTSLSYTGKGMHLGSVVGQGNFQFLGFNCDASLNMYKNYLFIDVFVPENFTLKKAYLSIQHLPIVIGNSSGTVSDYGICSNMKLYKTDVDSQQIYVVPQSDTSITGISNLTEISVLGSSGWTPTKPTSVSEVALEQKNVEIPISNFDTGGKLTRFAVASGASVPTSSSDNLTTIYKNSGAVIATITLIRLSERDNFLIFLERVLAKNE